MAHLDAVYRCQLCGEIPEQPPMFRCENHHLFCLYCFQLCQKAYKGSLVGGSQCPICQYSGDFARKEVSAEFLKKLKTKPGIGRPFRYDVKELDEDDDFNKGDFEMAVQKQESQCRFRKPLLCLHDGCRKTIASGNFLEHYKRDHSSVPVFSVERNQELALLFDLALVEQSRTLCLAIVNVYEVNRIDVTKSRSSQSVINACTTLSKKVSVNNFWLMISGSSEARAQDSYVVFWLYSNTVEGFHCTVELSSKNEEVCVSSFFKTVGLQDSYNIGDVQRSMNFLYASRGTFSAMLEDGQTVNLKVTVH